VTGIDSFRWTIHAERRLSERGLTRARVERAVRTLHPIRQSNAGTADWRVDAGTFVVVYDHPAEDGVRVARIVSVWKKHQYKRHLHEHYSG
jgi:hypothetical protein